MAERDGAVDLRLYVDWDRSGDDRTVQQRVSYQALVKALNAGELSAVYAYSADRLYRGIGSIAPILDAWERSGRRPRTCARILDDELRIPAARGGLWDRQSILRLVDREAPDRLPRRGPSGRREEPATPAVLAKLLRCHCGRTLSPNRQKPHTPRSRVFVSYYCAAGHAARADHSRVYIGEARLLPWIVAEAERLRVPVEAVETAETNQAERDAIDAKRQRIVDAQIEGLIPKDDRDRRLAELERQRDRVDARTRVLEIPAAIDWTWPPETVSEVLRSMWAYVQLDEQLRPVSAEWLVPEWRAA